MNRAAMQKLRREGWTVEPTRGGHLKLLHPEASKPIFTGSTPSDARAERNNAALMRRALPQEPKPAVESKPKVEAKKPAEPKPEGPKKPIEVIRIWPCPVTVHTAGEYPVATLDLSILGLHLTGMELRQSCAGVYRLVAPKVAGTRLYAFRFRNERVYRAALTAAITAFTSMENRRCTTS